PIRLARARLLPADGLGAGLAELELAEFSLYSRGEAVESAIGSATASVTMLEGRPDDADPLDVNYDGAVDAADLSLALYCYGAVAGDAEWPAQWIADVNRDGAVDMVDVMLLVQALHGAALGSAA
ncbi:MAG: dockerin type I repeat-containing protein, partial [Clostridiales bacterium]|nr:dockerin type I repeat-containing protein [Clostridiales bacterium]